MKKLLVFVMVSCLVGFLNAQPRNNFREGRRAALQRTIEKLQLTDTQKEQFQKVHFDTRKKDIDLRAKLETAHLDLTALKLAPSPEKSLIEKKVNEIAAIQASRAMNQFDAWSSCNKVLTADQQKIWKQVLMHPRGRFLSQRSEGMERHQGMDRQQEID
ncbi:MAG: hypothetical protein PHP42_12630 [Bacteroidota bacterium]|nr:hypothetical protein [Bacteroidota bacterium]